MIKWRTNHTKRIAACLLTVFLAVGCLPLAQGVRAEEGSHGGLKPADLVYENGNIVLHKQAERVGPDEWEVTVQVTVGKTPVEPRKLEVVMMMDTSSSMKECPDGEGHTTGTDNHTHTNACYQETEKYGLICDDKEHTHSEGCYKKCTTKRHYNNNNINGTHKTGYSCVNIDGTYYSVNCGMTEHTHSSSCYGTITERTYICGEVHHSSQSKSCSPNRLEVAKLAANQLIAGLPEGTLLTCMVYNSASNIAVVPAYDEKVTNGSGTNTYSAIVAALDEFSDNDTKKIFILLTDGETNNDSTSYSTANAALNTFKNDADNPGTVFVVGFNYTDEKLEAFASEDGGYMYASNVEQLFDSFDEMETAITAMLEDPMGTSVSFDLEAIKDVQVNSGTLTTTDDTIYWHPAGDEVKDSVIEYQYTVRLNSAAKTSAGKHTGVELNNPTSFMYGIQNGENAVTDMKSAAFPIPAATYSVSTVQVKGVYNGREIYATDTEWAIADKMDGYTPAFTKTDYRTPQQYVPVPGSTTQYYEYTGTSSYTKDGKSSTLNAIDAAAASEYIVTHNYRLVTVRQMYDVTYEYTGTVPEGAAALLPAAQLAQEEDEVTVAQAPVLDGWQFSGWSVASGNATIGEDGKFTMPSQDVKLVGSWEEIQEYNVTYTYTGDVPSTPPALPADAAYQQGATVTVAGVPADIPEGYAFSGWSVQSGDVTIGQDGTFIMPGNDVQLVGSWTKLPSYRVTVNYFTKTDGGAYVQDNATPVELVALTHTDDVAVEADLASALTYGGNEYGSPELGTAMDGVTIAGNKVSGIVPADPTVEVVVNLYREVKNEYRLHVKHVFEDGSEHEGYSADYTPDGNTYHYDSEWSVTPKTAPTGYAFVAEKSGVATSNADDTLTSTDLSDDAFGAADKYVIVTYRKLPSYRVTVNYFTKTDGGAYVQDNATPVELVSLTHTDDVAVEADFASALTYNGNEYGSPELGVAVDGVTIAGNKVSGIVPADPTAEVVVNLYREVENEYQLYVKHVFEDGSEHEGYSADYATDGNTYSYDSAWSVTPKTAPTGYAFVAEKSGVATSNADDTLTSTDLSGDAFGAADKYVVVTYRKLPSYRVTVNYYTITDGVAAETADDSVSTDVVYKNNADDLGSYAYSTISNGLTYDASQELTKAGKGATLDASANTVKDIIPADPTAEIVVNLYREVISPAQYQIVHEYYVVDPDGVCQTVPEAIVTDEPIDGEHGEVVVASSVAPVTTNGGYTYDFVGHSGNVTLNKDEQQTITMKYQRHLYMVETEGDAGVESLTATATYQAGTNAEVTYTLKEGYEVLSITVDGEDKTGVDGALSFTDISANHEVKITTQKSDASYKVNHVYYVVDPDGNETEVTEDNQTSASIAGKHGDSVTAASVAAITTGQSTKNSYKEASRTGDIELDKATEKEITITYKRYEYRVTTTGDAGVEILTATATYQAGTDVEVAYTLKEGYEVLSITVDGVDKTGVDGALSFDDISANHEVKITTQKSDASYKVNHVYYVVDPDGNETEVTEDNQTSASIAGKHGDTVTAASVAAITTGLSTKNSYKEASRTGDIELDKATEKEITITYKRYEYRVTTTSDAGVESLTATATYDAGTDVEVAYTLKEGYEVLSITVDGVDKTGVDGALSFDDISANHEVKITTQMSDASYKVNHVYYVVDPDGNETEVTEDNQTSASIAGKHGDTVTAASVAAITTGQSTKNSYKEASRTSDIKLDKATEKEITITYKRYEYRVTTTGDAGVESLTATATYQAGTDVEVAYTLKEGYEVLSITVDGVDKAGVEGTLSFADISANHEVVIETKLRAKAQAVVHYVDSNNMPLQEDTTSDLMYIGQGYDVTSAEGVSTITVSGIIYDFVSDDTAANGTAYSGTMLAEGVEITRTYFERGKATATVHFVDENGNILQPAMESDATYIGSSYDVSDALEVNSITLGSSEYLFDRHYQKRPALRSVGDMDEADEKDYAGIMPVGGIEILRVYRLSRVSYYYQQKNVFTIYDGDGNVLYSGTEDGPVITTTNQSETITAPEQYLHNEKMFSRVSEETQTADLTGTSQDAPHVFMVYYELRATEGGQAGSIVAPPVAAPPQTGDDGVGLWLLLMLCAGAGLMLLTGAVRKQENE